MEILFVSHKFPPSVGGMEKQSFELITGMERHCRVHRIVFDGSGSLIAFFKNLNQCILQKCRQHPGISLIHFNDALIATASLYHKGYEHLKKTATLHGLDVVFPSDTYHKRIFPKFNRFDHFIAVSAATARHATNLGIAPEKISVIHNGVDIPAEKSVTLPEIAAGILKKYGIPAGHRMLIAVGRPVKRKGFSWFVKKVVPLLRGKFVVLLVGPFDPKPKLTERLLALCPPSLRQKMMLFLGFGSDAAALRKLLSDKQLNGTVRHLGKLPADDKQHLLDMSDAFIMPNIHVHGDMEGFGLVCLEASISGATVFAADIDGIPDAIQHEKNGFLLPSADAVAWADALNRLIDSPQQFKSKSEAFRDFTTLHYSWEKMVTAYFDLFSRL